MVKLYLEICVLDCDISGVIIKIFVWGFKTDKGAYAVLNVNSSLWNRTNLINCDLCERETHSPYIYIFKANIYKHQYEHSTRFFSKLKLCVLIKVWCSNIL